VGMLTPQPTQRHLTDFLPRFEIIWLCREFRLRDVLPWRESAGARGLAMRVSPLVIIGM
jgi:hypothetical protein